MEWVSRSSQGARLARLFVLTLGLSALAGVGGAGPGWAKAYLSQEEALEIAFPGADRVEKSTHLLEPDEVDRIESLARSPLESKMVSVYTGYRDDVVIGYALIDVHTVRTKPEAFLFVLDGNGDLRSLRVLAFYEPEEYLPTDRWLAQFEDRSLTPRLQLNHDIHGIAGATLSAQAVTAGVRRALAIYQVLVAPEAIAAEPPTTPGTAGAPLGAGH